MAQQACIVKENVVLQLDATDSSLFDKTRSGVAALG
jgi:hypothetical protein